MRLIAMLALSGLLATPAPAAEPKIVVTRAAEMPRRSYDIPKKPSEMLDDRDALEALARAVERDADATLARYDIREGSALRQLHVDRAIAAALLGRFDDSAAALKLAAAAEEKEANRLTGGLHAAALAAAMASPEAGREATYRAALSDRLAALPAATVRARIIERRRGALLTNATYARAETAIYLDQVWAKSRRVDGATASWLLETADQIGNFERWRPIYAATLQAWLDNHPVAQTDIWSARTLSATGRLAPVAIGIWDTGVDPAVFPGRVTGIGYTHQLRREDVPLLPLGAGLTARLGEHEQFMRGRGDLARGLDTPAARFAADKVDALTVADVAAWERESRRYPTYIHGTVVADIAVAGLPDARIVSVRRGQGEEDIPPPFDEARARRFAEVARESVAFMRANQVRVANLSWGYTAVDIEQLLALNGIEPDETKRVARAQAIFDIMFDGMRDAMASAPEILFVIAAGNTNESIDFVRDMPGSIDLPNVLAVGAVDGAGALTSFASTGKSVDLFALGYNVEARVPGGATLHWSGASLSAPQVVNAAAKLIAMKPALTSVQVAKALVTGATPAPGSTLPLLDAKRALQLIEGTS